MLILVGSERFIDCIKPVSQEEAKGILEKISGSLVQLQLERADNNDLKTEIETINTQLESSNPKRSIILECFNSIKGILEKATASALSSELIDSLNQISF